jgi:hypothetical protein
MAARLAWFPDDWAKYPKLKNEDGTDAEGPRAIRVVIDATTTAQEIDLGAMLAEITLSNIQCVKIDNLDNAGGVTIQSLLTSDRIKIGGGCQGIVPWVFTANDNKFTIALDSGAGVVVVWLFNTPKPLGVWNTAGGDDVVVTNTVTVAQEKANTSTRTSVAQNAADVALLAAAPTRKGGTVFNDSVATLYLALGAAAASASDFTAEILPRAYYELPANYAGAVRGIWSAAGAGAARISELT